MTTFFTDDSGDLQVLSPQQLYARAALVQDLHSDEIESATAVAWYRFPEKIPCGLSNCHQGHQRGYVARLPDAREVHMGKDCGTRHLGEEWKHATIALDSQARLQQLRKTLDSALSTRTEVESELEQLAEMPSGARWITRAKRQLESEFPDVVVDTIKDYARRRETAITIEVELSKDEIEKRSAGGQRVAPVEIRVVGRLQGLEIWRETPGQMRKRIDDIYTAIDGTDRSQTDTRKLTPLATQALQIGEMLQSYRDFVAAGEAFFTPPNLTQLPLLTTDSKTARQVEKLVKRWIELSSTA